MNLYDDYLKMINDAESFMKVHKVRMSGEDIRPGIAALVIPQSLLNEFAEKLMKADIIIDINERRKKDLLEENQKIEKEKIINNALDMLQKSLRKSDNPYDVPEQSSGSDDAAFYFPFGRD